MNAARHPYANRRRIRFVDERLQRNLLIALVVLEVVLVVIAVIYINHGFKAIIESRLYAVHPSGNGFISAETWLVTRAVIGLLLGNLAALILADAIWRRQTRRVLDELRATSVRMAALDLRPAGDRDELNSHQLVELLRRWQAKEHEQWQAIHRVVTAIEPGAPTERLGARLRELKRMLETRRSWRRHGG